MRINVNVILLLCIDYRITDILKMTMFLYVYYRLYSKVIMTMYVTK